MRAVPEALVDRIDNERRGGHRRTTFGTIRARVEAARARQSARIANVKDSQNAQGAGLTTNADTPHLQLR